MNWTTGDAAAVTVTSGPDTLTVAALVLDERAMYVSRSPSESFKQEEASSVALRPPVIVRSEIDPTVSGTPVTAVREAPFRCAWFQAELLLPDLSCL